MKNIENEIIKKLLLSWFWCFLISKKGKFNEISFTEYYFWSRYFPSNLSTFIK